jgi:hypothetical protein
VTSTGSGVEKQPSRRAHNPETAGAIPATAPPVERAYRTESEAAEYLRVSAHTLRGWRVSGKGPRFREHGGRIVYATADLDRWSDGRARLSTSDVIAPPQDAPNNTTTP